MRLRVGNSECLARQLERKRNSDISKQFSHILYNKVRFLAAYRMKEQYIRTLQTIFLAYVSIFLADLESEVDHLAPKARAPGVSHLSAASLFQGLIKSDPPRFHPPS